MMRRLWKKRNEILHEDGKVKQMRIEKEEVKRKIKEEFDSGQNNVRAVDRYLFGERGIGAILQLHIIDQKHWLENVSAAKLRYLNKFDTDTERMEINMRSWLNTDDHG